MINIYAQQTQKTLLLYFKMKSHTISFEVYFDYY